LDRSSGQQQRSHNAGREDVLSDIIRQVGEQLAGSYEQQLLESVMTDIAQQFQGAPITAFLPILVLKKASESLRASNGIKAPTTGNARSSAVAVPAVKLDFLRFEFKYIISNYLRAAVEKDLSHFMMLDPFAAKQNDHRYFVRSLYYDDPAFTSYHEKVDGALRRAKFRLRTYTNDPGNSCETYLEIKGRYNSSVYKQRAGFADPAGSRIFADCASSTTDTILEAINDSPVAGLFRYELARTKIRPIMLIDYTRRPYLSRYDAEFRLTFDDNLRATVTNKLFPRASQSRRGLLQGRTVMEIKFKDCVPLWFHRILKKYGLQRESVSKICTGIEAWNLVPSSN